MATITIDGQQYEVDETDNLLKVALSKGFDLPYFCWHPELHSVGACRQCAVMQYSDEDDTRGKLVMACMTPAADGTRISIQDPEAREFRSQIIEWLMLNHPHDCPVCEEGGECHLQDMTLMNGHVHRRYRGRKRTHRNQDLGPFIGHEMNRCIACYRCVRLYRDYGDGRDLRVLGSHRNVYFGREADGPFNSEFSGNLVEVCPTGVFTDKTLGAQYTRKWDMQNAPGICIHCSLGCNTSPGSRKDRLLRIQNRYHGEINHYFLCDRGRFGGGFVNRDDRLREPLTRNVAGTLEAHNGDRVLAKLKNVLAESRGLVGVGSPRASLEDNFALRRLVGADRYCSGLGDSEAAASRTALALLQAHANHMPSLRGVEKCDAVLVLGEDVTQVAPRLALALRQSVRNRHLELARAAKIPKWHARAVRDEGQHHYSPLFIATPSATRLDDTATELFHLRPSRIAALGFAVAHALDDAAPAPAGSDPDTMEAARAIAEALKTARKPLIVAGTSLCSQAILRAAGNIMRALEAVHDDPGLFVTFQEANSVGVSMMTSTDVDTALAAVENGSADTLIVMQNDLYERAPRARVDAAIQAARSLIVLDHSATETAAKSDYVLPLGTFAEVDGTLINNEGRAQRFFQTFSPDQSISAGWRICNTLYPASVDPPRWDAMDDVIAAIIAELPQFAGIERAAPDAGFRKAGMRFPRSPHRFSGRTALYADIDVRERRPEQDRDAPLNYSMEGYDGPDRPASLRAFAWTPRWNANQAAITRFQDEVSGPLHGGDPGVRLLQPCTDPAPYAAAEVETVEGWLAIPRYHIFGSEVLSARAPAIEARMSRGLFTLNPASARELGIAAADTLHLTIGGEIHALPVTIDPSLPDKTIGVPVGVHGITGLRLPMQVTP